MWLELLGVVGLATLGVIVMLSPPRAAILWVVLGVTTFSWAGARVAGVTVTPDRVLFLLLITSLTLGWVRDRRSILKISPSEFAMVFFLAMGTLSILIGGGTKLTHSVGGLRGDLIHLAQGYAMPFAAFFIGKNLLRTDRDLHRISWAFIMLGFAIGSFGILQQFLGMALLPNSGYVATAEGRSFGTLTGPIEFGIIVSAGFFAALATLPATRNGLARVFLLATLLVTVVALVYSKTRGVLLGLAVGLVVIARFQPSLRRPLIIASGLGVLALAAAWPILAETDLVRYRLTELSPIYNRVALSATALNMASAHPIIGSGFGKYTFANGKWDYITSLEGIPSWYAVAPGVPHNEFLHILVQLGLVGLFAYLVPLWLGYRSASRLHLNGRGFSEVQRRVLVISMALTLAYITNGMLVDLAACTYASLFVYLLLGLTDAMRVHAANGPD